MRSYLLKLTTAFCFLLVAGFSQQALAQCDAHFGFESYDGPMPAVGGITFLNCSSGPYTEFAWDFGDGNYDSVSGASVTHFYAESGSYEVKLTVWDGNAMDCFDEYSVVVDVYISDNPCDQLDCVWPGDANGDGIASLEDLINIGVGFGMTGPPRDSISYDWDAQTATDWPEESVDGINYKHFDCNGDGTIGISDIPAIQNNYVMLENGVSITESNGIPITLSFDVDTVVITEEGQYLEVNAGINFGSNNYLMEEVYGVVFYLTYNKHYVVETTPPDFTYNDNSFFGDLTTTLPMARNIPDEGQMDIALARRNGENITGQGRIASVKFIIDADIIDGRVENEGEMFAVGVNVVKAVDFDGNELDISLPEEPTGVFFVNGIVTNTKEILNDTQFEAFPNPVNETLRINLDESLHPEQIELFNLLGERVFFMETSSQQEELNVSQLASGIYVLKVETKEGIGRKRIIVE